MLTVFIRDRIYFVESCRLKFLEKRAPGREWSSGGIVAALSAAFVVVVLVLTYGMSNRSSTTASGPSTTTSAPSTTGQGGSLPAPVMR
jgi:hypothetical protein